MLSVSRQGLITGLTVGCRISVDFKKALAYLFDVDKENKTIYQENQIAVFKNIFTNHKKGEIPPGQTALASVNDFLRDRRLRAEIEISNRGMIIFRIVAAELVAV